MIRILIAGVLAAALPLAAGAAGVVESIKGSARAGEAALAQGQKLAAPGAISTGAGSQATLKFDDGTRIVLSENSLLRVVDFRYTNGAADRAVFDLLRGGARVATGRIARENPTQFFFRTPQTQLTVEQPADFSVVVVNPAYVLVHAGSLLASNGWGTARLLKGSSSVIQSNATAPAAVAPSAVPGNAAAAMQNLGVASVGSAAGGSSAGVGATEAGAEGISFGATALLVAIGIAAIAVAKEADSEPSVSATTHH